jgi:glycosyltransferase involved in cell wall biosynthesis
VHTSSTITAKELIAHGVHKEKIVVIPIGTDTQLFRPATVEEKGHIRKSLGLPLDKIIIGSFQKDGNGWGDGDTPKLVKGPDIFCDAVEMVAKDHPVHVLLTGPARGYVIKRLKRAGISHSHFLLPDANSSAMYYRALDVYVIASRAEGGPKAILEAVASGVPLVTTNVGMVPDIMHNGVDCLVAPVGDVGVLAKNIAAIVQDQELPDKLKREGYTTAQHYDIRRTVKEYYQKIYTHLLS